jgi:hypothetical protein
MPDDPMEWRVDVKGYPVTVLGKHARDHLQQANLELARMKMALHRILYMDPEKLGKQGIYKAQTIAKEGLGHAKEETHAR